MLNGLFLFDILEYLYINRLINGQSYMETLAKAILAAREEIFISNWWISPELILVRPFQDDLMRLDNLLGKRAVSSSLQFNQMIFISIK